MSQVIENKIFNPIVIDKTVAGNATLTIFENNKTKNSEYEIVGMCIKITTDGTVANRTLNLTRYWKTSSNVFFKSYHGPITASNTNYVSFNSWFHYYYYPSSVFCTGLGNPKIIFGEVLEANLVNGVAGDSLEVVLIIKRIR